MTMRPRIVIADDHALLLEALTLLLAPAGDVVGTARDGAELLALVDSVTPDVIITDLSMPTMSGFDVLRAVMQRAAPPPVLVLTVHADVGTLRAVLAAKAAGYLVKSAASAELLDAVQTVLQGEVYIPLELRDAMRLAPRIGVEHLSPRQRAVLGALAKGSSAKQISAELGISERTVAFHREQLRKRLGVKSTVEMVELLRQSAFSGFNAISYR